MKWMVTMLLLLCAYAGTAQKREERQKEKDEVFTFVEEMPSYPGGDDSLFSFLANNIKYPIEAQKEGIEGRVVLRFVVTKTGVLEDIEVTRSLSKETDAEAIRVAKLMPKWNPGKQNGKAVSVYFSLPMVFKISD